MNEVSALIDAANQNDLNAIQSMINAGTDVFLSDYDKRTAMHLAASAGHTEMVRLLIGSVATT